MEEILFTSDVSRRIGVPEATLRYWRHLGIGPKSFKLGPRKVAYLGKDLENWIEEQYAKAGAR